jgi:hypothetical protein
MHSTILKRVALLMEKWRSVRLSCSSLLPAGFACATILSVASFAQAPLNFGNNFFVTGDYLVAGAYGMNTNFAKINGASYTTGIISVPDPNPGITGANQVPKGAQIVAALLYWQTIEKAGATGSGQNGYIRPLLYSTTGGPAAPGYAFSGTNVSPGSNVSWGPGGCSGTSTGNVLQTYRADVAASLPLDANGNPTANGSFQVSLPSAVLSSPFTLGATFVVIYRILSGAGGPNIPLNAIVINEGNYAPAKPQLTMTQPLQGFYDAAHNPVSRLTFIGNGGIGYQTVYLNSTALPSLYGSLLPPLLPYYGNWNNPTWTFTSASHNPSNPVTEDSSSATMQVVPFSGNQGCVSSGAVIVSTTVKNSDNDGILDSWKNNQGYCDVSMNPSCSGPGDPAWVPLPGANLNQQDVFLQYDYMCSSISSGSCVTGGSNYSFDPRLAIDPADHVNPTAVEKVVAAYANHGIILHAIPGNAIEESQPNISCLATDPTCPFPNEPGTVGFSAGLVYIKNQTIDQTGLLGCTPGAADPTCMPVFQHGKKDSYHYALFSHGVGVPNWFLLDGSLSKVQQSGNTVTFTTSLPHGIAQITQQANYATATDTVCTNGRVTVVFATTNSNLNGTFCVLSKPAPTATTFSITVPGSSTNFTYTSKTDPNLAVANGQVTTMSGYSDVGGQNSVISLGYGGWGPPNNPASDGNKWQIKAGTIHHEFGHTMALTHGGTFLNNLANNDYTPTYEANCKPNVQSSMSYLFQFDLLQVPGQVNSLGQPLMVVDYSEDPPPQTPELIPTLTKSSPEGPGILDSLSYATTAAFELTSYAGSASTSPHCNGTALFATDKPMTYVQFSTPAFFWSAATGEDLNFDGNTTDVLHPHNEWEGTPAENGAGLSPGLNLQQVSALGTITTTGSGGGGGLKPGGGASGLYPAGGGGGLKPGGGGLHPGGGGLKPGGGSGAEITHQEANSYARPPQGLSIGEGASPRYINLSWFAPTFGAVVNYNIYKSIAGGQFNLESSVPGSQTTFQDTVTCNPTGYSYRVTAVTLNDAGQPQESVPSNTVSTSGQTGEKLTGCYTNTSPGSVALTNLAFTDLSSPNTPVQGDNIQITWSLNDDDTGAGVTRAAASTALVAIGPIPSDAQCSSLAKPPEFLGYSGTYPYPVTTLSTSGSGVTGTGTPFAFTWSTGTSNAGCYFFELDLDSHQYEQSNALELLIYVSDGSPHVTITTLPNGVVGSAYSNTLFEAGGASPFTWSYTGSLPSGITLGASTGTVSGTTCVAGNYNFTAMVTDKNSNYGTQALMLQIQKANTPTGVTSNANPSVFQQPVTFTVTVAPQYSCVPTGTVTLSDGVSPIASNLPLSGGIATFTTSALSVGVHSITASYSGDANFNSSTSGVWSQTVNQASTSISLSSVSPSPAFVGQPITVSYTFSVVAPGAGSPIPPSGNIVVSAGGSACMAAAVQGAGMCTLSPAPTQAGTYAVTITYPGDGNFVASGANGNYTVYQLVFTTQPSNTGVGFTITPAVVVTAEDSSNNTLATFTGGITLAIGSGPGTLSGTLTQNAVGGVATFGDLSINQVANGDTLVASPTGGLPAATSNPFDIDTFYVDGNGNFGILDLPTGVVTQIGAGTVHGNTGLDLTPSLQVYEYNMSNQLMQIAPSTGVATQVGTGSLPNAGNTTTGGLTDGTYFGIDMVTGELYSINLTTGATTSVGTTPTSTALVPPGCPFETSLAGSATVLYYTIGSTGGGDCAAFPDTLYQINPANGATTLIGPVTVNGSGVNEFAGSTFVGGKLYGFSTGGGEYTIDPTTGVATFVTNTTALIFGAGDSE